MPRKSKGARLYFRKAKNKRRAVYVIRDGGKEYSTGTTDFSEAETALRIYLNERDKPRAASSENYLVTDALFTYGSERAENTENPERIGYAIDALSMWWSGRTVSDVNENSCHAYARDMREGYQPPEAEIRRRPVGDGTIRRELGCLRAALNLCGRKGLLSSVPTVTLPPAPPVKDRWLTRDEVARLIRAARKSPRTRYLARFILTALYTGSRKSVILGLGFIPHVFGGHVDFRTGKLHRKGNAQKQTKKNAPTIPTPDRLLRHFERWQKNGAKWVVEIEGHRVGGIKNDWETIREIAGMPEVTPHTLRHTAITWAMQGGANVWHVSGFFGVTMDTLEKYYAHHHPDYVKTAVNVANKMGKS
ncbi:site-specific integrase [Roseovarius sp. B08]|uniref:site-specific integrase n=1 Tax=Roseovarius sp. B08 TaxID=3449223 RepID=UPI003EDC768A